MLFTAAGLAGCEQRLKAPFDKGVCWHVVLKKNEAPRFNRMAENTPSLEYCAARLERMRRSFLSLGSGRRTVVGAYQGRFIFVEPRGIFSGKSLEGGRFLMLVRTGDGRLVSPGALPQAPAVEIR